MVAVGVATGLEQLVQLKSGDGLHVKVAPPFTFNVVELPIQTVGYTAVTEGGTG